MGVCVCAHELDFEHCCAKLAIPIKAGPPYVCVYVEMFTLGYFAPSPPPVSVCIYICGRAFRFWTAECASCGSEDDLIRFDVLVIG